MAPLQGAPRRRAWLSQRPNPPGAEGVSSQNTNAGTGREGNKEQSWQETRQLRVSGAREREESERVLGAG